jgi:hypothetical protein
VKTWEADVAGSDAESTNIALSALLSSLNSGMKVKPPDFKFADNVKAVSEVSPEPCLNLKYSPRSPKPNLSLTAYQDT